MDLWQSLVPQKPRSSPEQTARNAQWDRVKTLIVNYDEPLKGDVTLWMRIPADLSEQEQAAPDKGILPFLKRAFSEQAFAQVKVPGDIEDKPLASVWLGNEQGRKMKGPALKLVLSGAAAAEFRTQRERFFLEAELERTEGALRDL